MSSRRVVVWSVIVAVLALVRVTLALIQPRFEPPAALLDVDPSRVDRVTIERGETGVELVREGEGWVVESAGRLPAHPGVGALIERLASWRRERVAGETPREEWGVGADQGRRVALYAGDELLGALIVGQVTGVEAEDVREVGYALDTSQLGLFVRLPREKRVYVVTDFVTRELEPDPRRWFAPPLPIPPEQIARLQRAGTQAFDLRAAPYRFEGDPTPVDPRRAGALLSWIPQLKIVAAALPSLAAEGVPYRFEANGQAYTFKVAQQGERTYMLLGERGLEVEPLAASRLIEGTRASLIRQQLTITDPRDLARVEAIRGEQRVVFARARGGWVSETGAPPDLDALLLALNAARVAWAEPAVGQVASATLQLVDAAGNVESLWLLDTSPSGGERVALSGVSLVAQVEGRPLSEALRTILGD